MSQYDILSLIFKRNAFYRRQYLLAFGALVLSWLVIAMLGAMFFFLRENPTEPLYFAADSIGRLIRVVPVGQPNMSFEEVVDWAVEAVETTYSYDYVNYNAQMQNSQKYFTNYGWAKYLEALTASNNVVALTERKMIVGAKVIAPPKLVTQGLLAGAYAWKFQMPLLVTFWLPPFDDKSKFSNALTVTVTIQRQPILQSYRGLGIVQLIGSANAAG